jgi:hypothetical protein
MLLKIKLIKMKSTSERTFGSKLANAEKVSVHLKSFTGYTPPTTGTSIVNYDALIAALKAENTGVATKKANYSAAVDIRQKLFFKDKDAVIKMLAPIISAVRAKLGLNAKPVADITTLITKIRGAKKAKGKDPKATDAAKEETATISHSEKSYGSITQHFSDIIATLTTLGTDYAPANAAHKLTALQTKLTAITTASANATNTYGLLKTNYATRSDVYNDISERTQRIKEQVKSQYGVSSTEYKLIKGLNV